MKYALLIGINYIGTNNELAGCINDVMNVQNMLIEHFGYIKENITILTDETDISATRYNILHQLENIIHIVNENKGELWIHYSGHGSYMIDKSNDESDGRDEMLVPMDFMITDMISDDELNKIFAKVNIDINCILVFDCCHSGTIVDLPFCYIKGLCYNENKSNLIKSNILMISGCKDNQTSADTVINNSPSGALTGFLLNILKDSNYDISITSLCNKLWYELKHSGYSQYPILSCSKKIDLTKYFCHNNQLWHL